MEEKERIQAFKRLLACLGYHQDWAYTSARILSVLVENPDGVDITTLRARLNTSYALVLRAVAQLTPLIDTYTRKVTKGRGRGRRFVKINKDKIMKAVEDCKHYMDKVAEIIETAQAADNDAGPDSTLSSTK